MNDTQPITEIDGIKEWVLTHTKPMEHYVKVHGYIGRFPDAVEETAATHLLSVMDQILENITHIDTHSANNNMLVNNTVGCEELMFTCMSVSGESPLIVVFITKTDTPKSLASKPTEKFDVSKLSVNHAGSKMAAQPLVLGLVDSIAKLAFDNSGIFVYDKSTGVITAEIPFSANKSVVITLDISDAQEETNRMKLGYYSRLKI